MKRLHVIGRKNHGKTKLVVELVQELSRQGLRIGTIKHTHHRHELDTPGKDSHRHRIAGAEVVGILSQAMSAVFLPADKMPTGQDRYAVLAPAFSGCDLVLVEGDTMASAPKIEVWRAEVGSQPLATEDRTILAVVTDSPLDLNVEKLSRNDLARLVSWIQLRILNA
jgi:molybdopterin-guanine dinucleotide biosynthesis protein MobB